MINKNFNFEIIFIIGFIILIPLSSLIYPNLYGEDEISTFLVNIEVLDALKNFNLKEIIISLIKSYHPPGRNIFSIPTILIFGENITALRIPYYLTWIFTCYFSIKIIKEINNKNECKILSIVLLSGTGIFHIQIMGFGHGIVSFLGIYLIYKLIKFHKNKQKYIPHKIFNFLALICFVGFLFFNTFILLTLNIFLIQLFLILKNEKKQFYSFFLISFFHFLLYFAYYIIFIGFPYLLVNNPQSFLIIIENIFGKLDFGNWDQKPFGQYHQYTVRQNTFDLNYQSLLANLKYLNWHFFPYIGIFVIFIGIYYLLKKLKIIFLFILTYFFFVNFLMVGNTGQHFASVFIWLIPFFSLATEEKINISKNKFLTIFFYITIILFTFTFHIYFYNEKNYPYKIAKLIDGSPKWPPNIQRPLEEISRDVIENYTEDKVIYYTTDGAIIHSYLRDLKSYKINIDQILANGNKFDCRMLEDELDILITSHDIIDHCNDINNKTLNYENSYIKLFLK